MKALQSLTDLFRTQVVDEKNFDAWATNGAIFCTQSDHIDGFEVEYTANVFIQDAKLSPNTLFMHIVTWLNEFDPEREAKGLGYPIFALEPLDKGRFDLRVSLDIREDYSLEEDSEGDWMQGDKRYTCGSDFTSRVDEDELGELVHFIGHLDDLP